MDSALLRSQGGAIRTRNKGPQCVAVVFARDKGGEMRGESCLLRSHRSNVLLIGAEWFPHSGFRHFIRYINIRGVTPEEQGEGKEEIKEMTVGDLRIRECPQYVSYIGNQTTTQITQGKRQSDRQVKLSFWLCSHSKHWSILSIGACVHVRVLTWGHVVLGFERERACCSPWESEQYLPFHHWAWPAIPERHTNPHTLSTCIFMCTHLSFNLHLHHLFSFFGGIIKSLFLPLGHQVVQVT